MSYATELVANLNIAKNEVARLRGKVAQMAWVGLDITTAFRAGERAQDYEALLAEAIQLFGGPE